MKISFNCLHFDLKWFILDARTVGIVLHKLPATITVVIASLDVEREFRYVKDVMDDYGRITGYYECKVNYGKILTIKVQ